MRLVRSLAVALASVAGWAQQPAEEILQTEATPKPGEICAGCNQPIDSLDKVYLMEGQRVAVHRGHCDDVVRAAPLPILARLRATNQPSAERWFG